MSIKRFRFKGKRLPYIMLGLMMVALVFSGCSGDKGDAGSTTGKITGTVTASITPAPSTPVALTGVTVTTDPGGFTATTASDGTYTMAVPAGSYSLTFSLTNYTSIDASANVSVGGTSTVNAALSTADSGKPSVTLAADGQNIGYDTSTTVRATASSPSGYSLTYSWTGATGTDDTATATTPDMATAMAGVDGPDNDPGAFISGYTQENRPGVLPISDDIRGAITATVTADDGHGGTGTASITIHATGVQPGVRDVAIGIPVYLNSGHDDPNSWTLTSVPDGSAATLQDSTTRNPHFTPDVIGKYTLTEGSSTIDIYAGKWVGAISGGTEDADGVPSVTPDPGCQVCHNDTTAPDMFTPWKDTKHATFFASGLNGITHNSGTCANCHTVGFDNSAVATANDGYGDMMKAENWTYPSTRQKGNWTAMWNDAPQTARRTNIQCESCHGPNNTGVNGAHQSGSADNLRVDYSAEVCAQCHASGTHHHYYSEWNTLNPDTNKGHSKLAQMDATGYTGHAQSTNPSCSRCHTAQGFSAYADQLATGNSGPLSSSDVTWTKDTAQPQTCTACHDPHDASNPNQLRVYDSVKMTMAGFGVTGLGKGAICVTCHNIRNGNKCDMGSTGGFTVLGGCTTYTQDTFLHEDDDAYAVTWLSSPHDASQASIFMGRNAFFMKGMLPMLSKHANVEDSCVGCHMTLNPQTHSGSSNSHQFFITDADAGKLCANCHSANVGPEALKAEVENLIDTAGQKLSAELKTELLAAVAAGDTIYSYNSRTGAATVIPVDAATTITWAGEGSFNIGTVKAKFSSLTSDTAGTTPILDPAGNLYKGIWNVYLIEKDGSNGVHNPSFVLSVLNNTIAKF